MPLHKVEKGNNTLLLVQPGNFTDEQWHERRDLQPLLRDNPGAVDSDLFIISEELSNWEDSARRVDLLGLDKGGNLVVIELKRVEEGGHMELQAIRYAAMLSAMDSESVIHAHESFLASHGRESGNARQSIRDFLELDDAQDITISSTPHIILIAPGFSREITTTVLWLNNQGLDIRCIEANLYNLDGKYYLDIDQVIPLPSANDYQVKIREKTIRAEREASVVKRRGRTLDILVEHEILSPGTRLYLIYPPKTGLEITDSQAKYATFNGTGSHGITWDYDGGTYSLSSLCKVICERFGGDSGSGAFAGPDYWAIEGENQSLSTRASSLSKPQ